MDQGIIDLIYMPTDKLVADILTKPLVGWKFQHLLYKLIGWNNAEVNKKCQFTEKLCLMRSRGPRGHWYRYHLSSKHEQNFSVRV
jgi:hypothetical protein